MAVRLLGPSAIAVFILSSVIGLSEQYTYSNEISNVILESCMRTELEKTTIPTFINRKEIPLFEEYSYIWKSCASQVDNAECGPHLRVHESGLDVVKSSLIDVWKDLDVILPIWAETVANCYVVHDPSSCVVTKISSQREAFTG
ncbi:hypothetical protein JTE90_003221 [Oedothorax gibbosus]|uniref:Uncharacterized protein n=1 Tax=Oedothorax gibbosus TaxID=931172 RepID=A0AAV6UN76_9ARAC|nr:hypothetical protein JTE90_003221 [Oedothorax gibbosus]